MNAASRQSDGKTGRIVRVLLGIAVVGGVLYARHNPLFVTSRLRILKAVTAAADTPAPSEAADHHRERDTETANRPPTNPGGQTAGDRIANGHAFAKHGHEFGFTDRAQMAAYVDRVIDTADRANIRHLVRRRTGYWDAQGGAVVIVDPDSHDGGTAFKPNRGRAYFESLR